jgi:hypothetical protein
MNTDTQKLDSNQRQQIMLSVQQQMAIQHAQELLQVTYKYIYIYIYEYIQWIMFERNSDMCMLLIVCLAPIISTCERH